MSLQLPMFTPTSDWKPPKVSELPSWANAKRVGIDLETKDPHLKALGPGALRSDSHIAGISFAIEDGPAFYLPIRHLEGGNLPVDSVMAYLKDQAKCFKGLLCGANLSYDLAFLASEGIWFHNARRFRDTLIADPLINELHNSYSLQAVAERWGLPGKDEELLRRAAQDYKIDPKSEMWKLPSKFVGPYATQDAVLPLQLLRKQERVIDDQELWGVYDLESDVLPVLVKMHMRGVLIDQDKLEFIESKTLAEEAAALQEVYRQTGVRIAVGDVWKAEVLKPAVEAMGLSVGKTQTGKPNIDKHILAAIEHPAGAFLQRARDVNKLRTTFADSIRRYMINGRIHCHFNQLARDDGQGGVKGAKYGRLSSNNPNIQQQPSRGEFAGLWRSIYLPEPGMLWACNDYSQQEPRMLTHFAELTNCRGAFEAAERYRTDPTTDNHDMMTNLVHGINRGDVPDSEFNQKRKYCKDIFLGLCYSMGGAKLCREIGLPTKIITVERNGQKKNIEVAGDEGQAILDKFNGGVPYVRQMAKKTEDMAKKRGYLKTLSGRRCHFPTDDYGNFDWTHKALNRLIQGSSGDQTKAAMVAVDKAGYEIQLQVHDELDQSVENPEQAEEIAEIMRTCLPLQVPSKVDVEIGPNWGEIE